MPVTWADDTKALRMTASRDRMDAGSGVARLEIGTLGYNAAEVGTKLLSVPLAKPSGSISGPIFALAGPWPKTVDAVGSGIAATAVFVDSDGLVVGGGMTVGVHIEGEDDPDVIIDNVDVKINQKFSILIGSVQHA